MLKLYEEIIEGVLCISLHDRIYSIMGDNRGVREKFWLVRTGGKRPKYNEPLRSTNILFKFNRNHVSCEDWGETYASAIARKMGVPCVEYYSAELYDYKKDPNADDIIFNNFKSHSKEVEYYSTELYDYKEKLIGNGVVCGNYKRHDKEVEYSGFDLQNALHKFKYDQVAGQRIDGLNTVDGFIDAIRHVFKGKVKEEDLIRVRNDLIKQAIFDFLLAQTDRHWLNTTFLASELSGELFVRKAECYDNGCIALLKRKMSAIEGMSREIGKLGKDSPYLQEQLANYCPMFGFKTSTVVIEDRTGKGNLDRLKVVEPKKSKETFLNEIAEEILINPVIASFFRRLENMQEQGIVASVTKDLHSAGDNPPPYVAKMIRDVVGHQFDLLQARVHTRLKDYKYNSGMGGM